VGQVIKNFFYTLWIGFCQLVLFLLVVGLAGGLLFGGFWLVCAVFWVSFVVLGHTTALVIWITVGVIAVSFGIGKEFKNMGWDK
jgi:hypothetical protein